MKIVVLGANGQLGSDILRMNQDNYNLNIFALTRQEVDVTDKNALNSVLHDYNFDILINCTSYHNTEQVEANVKLAFDINAFAVKEMATICKEKQSRFFHISTDYVFQNSNHPLTEESVPSPLNIYGSSKLMGEALATSIHNDTVIFRVASLFGVKGASGKGGNFVETIIKKAKEKKPLRVIADQKMSPTYTYDLAEMILKSAINKIPPGIYHAVNSGRASWYEFAQKILELANIKADCAPITAKEYLSIVLRPTFSVLDNSKIKKYVGDIPIWQDALERYLTEKKHIA